MDEGKRITSAKRCKALDARWTSAVPSCCEFFSYFTVAAYLRPVFCTWAPWARSFHHRKVAVSYCACVFPWSHCDLAGLFISVRAVEFALKRDKRDQLGKINPLPAPYHFVLISCQFSSKCCV